MKESSMTTAAETEPRALESTAQPNTGKGAADPPEPTEAETDSEQKAQLLEAVERLEGLEHISVTAFVLDLLEAREQPRPGESAADPPTAAKQVADYFPDGGKKKAQTQWAGELLTLLADKPLDCLTDAFMFAKEWKPGESTKPLAGREQSIARINTLLPTCSPDFLRGLADEIAEQQSETTDADADDESPKNGGFEIGERMKPNHIFGGWAVVIRNVLPMLQAITCFTDEDERETAYNDQDGIGIDEMVCFARKELEAVAKHCDRAASYSNPRFITPSGHVWKLEAEAVLIEKPADTEGGAS